MITKDIEKAAETLLCGGVVIFPTETVWGMGANAYAHEACQRIYEIKQRPQDNPFILHVSGVEHLLEVGDVDKKRLEPLREWMPGPLTLIVKARDHNLFSSGLETIGVRIPNEPVAQKLLEACGIPIAAPSCNLSGRPSMTRFEDVCHHFEDQVDLILEGDHSVYGIESTVIDLTHSSPVYLRPGIVSFEEAQEIFPDLIHGKLEGTLRSPGLKYRHYAPDCHVVMVDSLLDHISKTHVARFGFLMEEHKPQDVEVRDNNDYAYKLYAFFNACDRQGIKTAYVERPQKGPLEHALLHRLEKASKKN